MNKPLDGAHFPALGYSLVEALWQCCFHFLSSDNHLLRLREVVENELCNLADIGGERVDDGVWACIVRVSSLGFLRETVVFGDDGDDGAADVVHVKYRWVGIKSDGMELVGVPHGDLRKVAEVLVCDGALDIGHTGGDDGADAMLEERGGDDGALHATGTAGAFLCVVHNADEGFHLWPVGLRGDLAGFAV